MFEPDVLQLFLRDLFIILSRFLAGSCSLKISQAFYDPFDQFPSRVAKVNTFKTPEMERQTEDKLSLLALKA